MLKQNKLRSNQKQPMIEPRYRSIEQDQLFSDSEKLGVESSRLECRRMKKDFSYLTLQISRIVTVLAIVYFIWVILHLCVCQGLLTHYRSQDPSSFCSLLFNDRAVSEGSMLGESKSLLALVNTGSQEQIATMSTNLQIGDNHQSVPVAEIDESRVQQIEEQSNNLQRPEQLTTNQGIKGLSPKIVSQRYQILLQKFEPQNSEDLSDNIHSQDNADYLSQRRTLQFLSQDQRQSIIQKYLQTQNDPKSVYLQFAQQNEGNTDENIKMETRMNWLPSFEGYQQKTSFCVILSTFNNAASFQIARALNSVFNQDYQKYHVVIMDRSSTDATVDIVRAYLNASSLLSDRTVLVEDQRDSELAAVYNGLRYCEGGEIAVLMNGDGELLGRTVFKLTDYTYQRQGSRVVYADGYNLDLGRREIERVRGGKYDESERFMSLYREIGSRYGEFFSFDTALIASFEEGHLTDVYGAWFRYSGNQALYFSLLQASCGSMSYLSDPLILVQSDGRVPLVQLQAHRNEVRSISRKSRVEQC